MNDILKNAEKQGAIDFQAGKKGMSTNFVEYACKSEYDTAELMKAYNHGYTIALLAEKVTSDFPSAKELKRILSN